MIVVMVADADLVNEEVVVKLDVDFPDVEVVEEEGVVPVVVKEEGVEARRDGLSPVNLRQMILSLL